MRFAVLLKPTPSGVEIRLPDLAAFFGLAATVTEAKGLGRRSIYDAASTLARLGKPMWEPQGFDLREPSSDDVGSYWTSIEVTLEHLFVRQAE